MEFVEFITNQLRTLPVVKAPLTGKTILLTGGNNGIGYETALHLARLDPARLIIACRSMDKGEKAVQQIKDATGSEFIECWKLDLSSYESVKAFGKRYKNSGLSLDILIANAGMSPRAYELTKDGHECAVQTNYLSQAYLVFLLCPVLRAASNPHIIILASEVHKFLPAQPRFSIQYMDNRENFVVGNSYMLTKLANIFFVAAFHERYPEIRISSINPGLCRSGMFGDGKPWAYVVMLFVLGRTSEVGARNTLWAIFKGPGEGEYVDSCAIGTTSAFTRSEQGLAIQDALWKEMCDDLMRFDPSLSTLRK